jgi:hypothetical protein
VQQFTELLYEEGHRNYLHAGLILFFTAYSAIPDINNNNNNNTDESQTQIPTKQRSYLFIFYFGLFVCVGEWRILDMGWVWVGGGNCCPEEGRKKCNSRIC